MLLVALANKKRYYSFGEHFHSLRGAAQAVYNDGL